MVLTTSPINIEIDRRVDGSISSSSVCAWAASWIHLVHMHFNWMLKCACSPCAVRMLLLGVGGADAMQQRSRPYAFARCFRISSGPSTSYHLLSSRRRMTVIVCAAEMNEYAQWASLDSVHISAARSVKWIMNNSWITEQMSPISSRAVLILAPRRWWFNQNLFI